MRAEWCELDRRIKAFDDEFAALAKTDDAARRLVSIAGIGVMNATALVAAIGKWRDIRPWPRSCGLAWLGATADGDRWQAAPAGDQQAREQISAQAAGPRCPGGLAILIVEPDADWAMARFHHPQTSSAVCAGQRGRLGYEDRDARNSILAGATPTGRIR